jgi:hypothetical protein
MRPKLHPYYIMCNRKMVLVIKYLHLFLKLCLQQWDYVAKVAAQEKSLKYIKTTKIKIYYARP